MARIRRPNTLPDLQFGVYSTSNRRLSKIFEHVGRLALLTRGLDEVAALKVLSRAVGTTVLAASTTTQQALEGYEDHGLFTYVVAQGLMGKGGVDQNGVVNTLALAHYVDANVPELAQQNFNHPQYPTIETNGPAFPLTKVR